MMCHFSNHPLAYTKIRLLRYLCVMATVTAVSAAFVASMHACALCMHKNHWHFEWLKNCCKKHRFAPYDLAHNHDCGKEEEDEVL